MLGRIYVENNMKANEIETLIQNKLRDELYQYLINHEYEIDVSSSYETVLLAFKDYKEKRLPIIRYKVKFSSTLERHFDSLPESQKQSIELFKYNFENGNDMNSHLSKYIFQPKDDRLLNFWGIKHLHLNDCVASSKNELKNNRSNTYLLICCYKNEILFLDVMPHLVSDQFANIDFLNILNEDNWLEKAGFVPSDAKSILPEITTSSDIYELWKSHVNVTGFTFNGKMYTPINGESLAGSSLSSTNYMIDINHRIFKEAKKLECKENIDVKVSVDENGVGLPEWSLEILFD